MISVTIVAPDLDSFRAQARRLWRISCELNQIRVALNEAGPETRLPDIGSIRELCEEAGIDLDSVFSEKELVGVERFVDNRIDGFAEELRELSELWAKGESPKETLNSVYEDLHYEITTLVPMTLQETYLLELELEFLRLKNKL